MTKRLFAGAISLAAAVQLWAQTPSPTPGAQPTALATPAAGKQTLITEIYADEASFDTEKRIGIFTGHVRVFDPRFNVQSDKLTAYIHKEENQGLERAVAVGHVGVVREKPDPKGGPPSKAVGLSEKAIYTSSDGNVEMSGSPRVQQGLDTHISTSPQTIMVLSQDGHLTTHGPSRTEIRQEAADQKKPAATPTP
ncbi:MAG: hypothetical protein H0X34_09385 [Chthoniobacterales bacterium]|nr:hypothetical protein [Chthoniobacterales bacterium]